MFQECFPWIDSKTQIGESLLLKDAQKWITAKPDGDWKNTGEHGAINCFVCGKNELYIRDYCEECCKFFGIKE